MLRFVLILLVGWATSSMVFADAADQAVGYWKSVSDVKGEEGKVTALWKFSVDARGQLQAAIAWVPGKNADSIYVSTKPEYNGLPVKGTFWLKGLQRSGADSWKNGTIVDISNPKSEVYGCEVKVVEGGRKLEMRGYMGISLLGRTQTWINVPDEEAKKLVGN